MGDMVSEHNEGEDEASWSADEDDEAEEAPREVEAEEEVVEEEAPVEAWFWNYIFQICKMLKIKFFHCMKLMDFKIVKYRS